MKTIQLNLYELTELEETARKKAIDANRYINVDDQWWEFVYDDFISICGTIGITVDKKDIFFRGFYSQGDGSAFSATINLLELIDHIASQNRKSYAPQLDLNLTVPEIDRRILKLIREGKLDVGPQIIHPNRGYYVKAQINENLPYRFKGHPQIEKQLDLLERSLEQIAETLNSFLYKSVEQEFDYQNTGRSISRNCNLNYILI